MSERTSILIPRATDLAGLDIQFCTMTLRQPAT
ncbi:hypothetical protein BCM02_109305 [Paenibacillus methanolicus]|uniref:Uncharacterized protein n=1 Tax=Paenibacillus methanolicus TaxID=582686 RepID=A0A5S5C0Q1_9BACL|nr:hypothetical protein BCM02_109305 [Paenibacillus methanolicus]